MKSRAETARSQVSILRTRHGSSLNTDAHASEQEVSIDGKEPGRNSVASEDIGGYIKDKGASITLTYKDGLVVQVLPNGAV